MKPTEINSLLPAKSHPAYVIWSDNVICKYYDTDDSTRDAVVLDGESITFWHFESKNPVSQRQAQFSVTTEDGGIDWAQILGFIDTLWMDPGFAREDPRTFRKQVLSLFEGLGQLTEYPEVTTRTTHTPEEYNKYLYNYDPSKVEEGKYTLTIINDCPYGWADISRKITEEEDWDTAAELLHCLSRNDVTITIRKDCKVSVDAYHEDPEDDAAGNRRIARGIVEAIWAWEDNPV